MYRMLTILLALLTALPVFAEKRHFTIEDLYAIKSVRDPQFSPDGRLIAFSVTAYTLETGKSNSDIHVMNTDGGGLHQLTRFDGTDTSPRWSPDGSSLYFISTRQNGRQVWKLSLDGGEPQQITDFAPGVEDFLVAGNGAHLVFFSEVFPECGADGGCTDSLNSDIEAGPLKAFLADDLFYRHWNFWKEGRRMHTFSMNLRTKKLTDLTPGNMDAPSFTAGGHAGFDVSPDAEEVCLAANRDSNHWETTNKDLWLIPLEGGEMVNITDENEAYDGNPAYSPDGRYIAYIMQKVPIYESDLLRLAIYNRETKEKKILSDDFDYWVNDIHWSPDSRSIYIEADKEGNQPIFRVDVRSGNITETVNFQTVDEFAVSPDGKLLTASRRSVGEPREIWRATTAGKNKTRLTTFNKTIEATVDIRPAEQIWIESPTGKRIHTFVVKPHNFDPTKKYPLILNVHGGPQSQWTDGFRGDWQVYPGAGYVVAFPNPHGSSGYGQDFTRAISRDWGGKVYQDVMAVADALAKEPWVDENRMGAMGWSYGGYMMMWLAGHTERFKAISAMMGLYNLTSFYGTTEELWFPNYDLGGPPWESADYQKWSPHKFAKNVKTPCLVITGQKDYRVSFTQSLEFHTALQKQGIPSRLIVFKEDGHWPAWAKSMPLYYNAHLEWFHQYLGGDAAPYDSREMVRNRGYRSKATAKKGD